MKNEYNGLATQNERTERVTEDIRTQIWSNET
jgi:hypothetical protein